MDLFNKAFETLQTNTFDKKRYLTAVRLYRKAKGKEREMIGGLFESQLALAGPKDIEWVSEVSHLFDVKE